MFYKCLSSIQFNVHELYTNTAMFKTRAIDNCHLEPSADQDKAFDMVDNGYLRGCVLH